MRPLLAAVFALGAFIPAACYKEASDLTAYKRYTGGAAWEVDGVRPGQGAEEVKKLLGAPRDMVGAPSSRTWRWDSRDMSVTFDAQGTAIEVLGGRITASGKAIVWSGLTEAEVTRVLGPGKVTTTRSPSGSGVINLGYKVTGKMLTYQDGDVRFEVMMGANDSVHHVVARR